MTAGFHIGDVQFLPELAGGWLLILLAGALILLGLAVWRRAAEFLPRVALFLLLAVLLLNPVLRSDERRALPDKLLIVVDESGSQKIANRDENAEAALTALQEKLAALDAGIEPVILRVPQYSDTRRGESTRIFDAMRDSMLSLPLAQVAGAVIITDGQVHDAPETAAALGPVARLAPLHVILTGSREERDRKITVVHSPQYGLINQSVDIDVRVDEQGGAGAPVAIEIWQDGRQIGGRDVAPGVEARFTLPLEHPGQNVFEFRVPVMEGEMTAANNTAPVIVNAVRDRLRVLLVSGTPHMGERAWRNLLKSDPGIDLIHFTILRPPTAMDMTPQNEMSLIVFPVDELFSEKIADFDLIIFDKYQEYSLLQPAYFDNIRAHVRGGGAFLLAMGSDRTAPELFQTALADTLPVTPAGDGALSGAFSPALTDVGKRHPVTADLVRRAKWGEWLTQADIRADRGQTLMQGRDGKPLLVVDQVGEGRVAVVASDNLWLWAKGGRTAGPYNELLRNLSHWLMKEPELEQDYLKAEARGRVITVSQRDDGTGPRAVAMTAPDGAEESLTLSTPQDGWLVAEVTADQNGIYVFQSGERKAFVVVGTARSEEYNDVLTTPARLTPAVTATGGATVWHEDMGALRLRAVDAGARRLHGDNWIGLRRNEAYDVIAVKARTLVTNPLFLLLAMGGLLLAWLAESGRRWRR